MASKMTDLREWKRLIENSQDQETFIQSELNRCFKHDYDDDNISYNDDREYGLNWTEGEDYEVKNGSVNIIGTYGSCYVKKGIKFNIFPIKFGKIENSFICNDIGLTTLKNSPIEVGKFDGNFNCSDNNLSSLEYAPKKVTGRFNASNNPLTSLKGIESNSYIHAIIITYNISSPLLRLLVAKGYVVLQDHHSNDSAELSNIFNKYIRNDSLNLNQKVLHCKEELKEMGLHDNAKW
jgi:hypothetical protein